MLQKFTSLAILPKLLDSFMSKDTPFAKGRNTSLSPAQISMKPILVFTEKVVSGKATVKVNEKKKADTNGSEGPFKKRLFIKDYASKQLCTSKNFEEHIRSLVLIQSLNKTMSMPFRLGIHQAYASLVSSEHISSIHKPYYDKMNFMQMKKSFNIESTTSSKYLHALINKNVHDKRQSSFGSEVTQGRHESNLEDYLHVPEIKIPTVNKRLSLIQDKDNLSELQCLIRENIEFFTATEQDESTYFR